METRAQDFIAEAREHLTALEQILLSLEKPSEASSTRERLDASLRIVHSLKGDAGFLGYSAIRTLANAMETVLEAMRDGGAAVAPMSVETLLVARDRLAALADDVKHSQNAELGAILAQLESLCGARTTVWHDWNLDLRDLDRRQGGRLLEFFRTLERSATISYPRIELPPFDLTQGLPQGAVRYRLRLQSSSPVEALRDSLGLTATAPETKADRVHTLSIDLAAWATASQRPLGELLAEMDQVGRFEPQQLNIGAHNLAASLPGRSLVLQGALHTALTEDEVVRRLGLPAERSLPRGSPPQAAPHSPSPGMEAATAIRGTLDAERPTALRIPVELLDQLMTSIGELTLVRNQSLVAFDQENGQTRSILQRLNAVTSELQASVLRTRMQPVGSLFGKFPRVIRDLGRQLGKQVEVTIVGRDVEIDKTILERLADPLTHLVRNSVDHGIETPDQRILHGKPPTGQITLTARHEDGQVRIEIRDDGRGIDPQAVRAKALSLRLKTESELEGMSHRELLGLILLPGFSTAAQVTEVSGRGVGMDVVKTNLESLEGMLTIDSQLGIGTAMVLRLPLTLAIIPCLIVVVDGERSAVPQREVEEVVCLHPKLDGRIEQAFDTEVYRLRNRLLPIVRVSEVIRRPQPFTADTKAEILRLYAPSASKPSAVQYLVVVRQGSKRYGLLVDDVRGTEEIVVKPMQSTMKRLKLFNGATIMGDGRIALIVNVAGLIEHARISFAPDKPAATSPAVRDAAEAHRLLLFEYGTREQFALPLLLIRRIEALALERIERVGEHEYAAIGGVATRILRLDRVLAVSQCAAAPTMHLVLPKLSREPVGILVSRIVDCESLSVDLQPHAEKHPGVLGVAMIRDRPTLLLDMHYLQERLFGPEATSIARPATARQSRVLLVDDTPFFREAVGRYLRGAGVAVTSAVDGADGLEKLADGPFDLIVSDLEMPVMDGWEFARQVRQRGFSGPLLALSSLSKPASEARARSCGFDYFEEKLNHDRLVQTVRQMLAGEPPK